jgi:SAM-dependent methyltransferase
MELRSHDLAYFEMGAAENARFWRRFPGGMPVIQGQSVLDLGCGHGRLCVELAEAGAAQVLGLDINQQLIDFAAFNLQQNFPELRGVVGFTSSGLASMKAGSFDLVVSKDSFEHVIDLDGVLQEIARCLRPGGRLYAGFGPLWNSPFGGHRRTPARIPWGHLRFTEAQIVAAHNRRYKRQVVSLHDLDLNGLSLADYRRIFASSELHIVHFRINASDKPVSRLFSLAARIPGLEEYFSHNIYCILEKCNPAQGAASENR